MLKTTLLVLLQTVVMTAGDLLLAKGMKQVGDIAVLNNPTLFFMKMGLTARNGWVWIGIACLAISLLLWLAVLSRAPLSLAVPMTAVAYVLNAFAAKYILMETVSPLRWTATGVIALGILLLIRS